MTAKERLLKRRPREVVIDGDKFYVRSLTLAESLTVEEMLKDEGRQFEMVSFMLSRALVDEDGQPVFADGDEQIREIPLELMNRLTTEINRASGVGNLEKTVKN